MKHISAKSNVYIYHTHDSIYRVSHCKPIYTYTTLHWHRSKVKKRWS